MTPRRLVLATANPGKARELAALVADWGPVELLSLAAFPGIAVPEEGERSYAENAVMKAKVVAAATGLPALADDSGLEVEALQGRLGVRSARFAGTDAARVTKLVELLRGVPEADRRARFCCVVALVWPDGRTQTAEGECAGRIASAPSGAGGFGYDPVFVADELGCTFAEAPAEEKHRVSHRGRALRALREQLARP